MVSSEFISKIEFACKKKESLYSQSKFKYAIRSMFAGAFLTFSTAAGAVGADLINKIAPGSGRFLFPFVFAWGLAYIVFLNAELVTSNMMFLTAGSFLKKNGIRSKISSYCKKRKTSFLLLQLSKTTKLNSRQLVNRLNFIRISKPNNLQKLSGKVWNSMQRVSLTRSVVLPFQMLTLKRITRFLRVVPKGILSSVNVMKMGSKLFPSCLR